MMRARVLVLLAALLPGVAATEGITADVQHQRGIYTLILDLKLGAPPEAVFAVLTDYAHLDRVNDAVSASEVLYARDPKYRVRIVMSTCVLFFCTEMVQVQQITHLANREIAVYVIPDEENFRTGSVHWRVSEDGAGTRVNMNAEYEPGFWVPPFIGPAILKRKLRENSVQSAANLERLAAQANLTPQGPR